jgi:hypothetical protein
MRITSALRRHVRRRHVPAACLASIVVALHPVPSFTVGESPAPASLTSSVPGYELRAQLCLSREQCGSLALTVRTSPDRFPRVQTQ